MLFALKVNFAINSNTYYSIETEFEWNECDSRGRRMVSTMKHLEDYVSAMENRSEGMDVHDELRQKEKDLMLAAELGKALLDKVFSRKNLVLCLISNRLLSKQLILYRYFIN